MAGDFRLNQRELQRMLDGADGVDAVLMETAGKVLEQARALAPVVDGDYRDSLHLVNEQHHDRMVVHVVADVDHAAAVERRHHVLSRALRALGGKVAR